MSLSIISGTPEAMIGRQSDSTPKERDKEIERIDSILHSLWHILWSAAACLCVVLLSTVLLCVYTVVSHDRFRLPFFWRRSDKWCNVAWKPLNCIRYSFLFLINDVILGVSIVQAVQPRVEEEKKLAFGCMCYK